MKSSYVIWARSNEIKHSCVLDQLVGFEERFQLKKGVPLAENFPDDVHFTLHPDFPHNLVLIDSLNNVNRLIVGSKRLREFFQVRESKCVEFLPVGIMGHKGKLLSKEYSIIHPIDPVDCLDIEKAGVSWNRLVKGKISSIKRLALDPSRFDTSRDIFRLDKYFDLILVRRDVAQAIDAERFTGVRWIEPEDYPEE